MSAPNHRTVAETQSACPIEQTLAVIGKKWTLLIIRDLLVGTRRFGELQRSLAGISPRTLSARLGDLERDGIITKTTYPEVPLHTEYELTPQGRGLMSVLQQMRQWHSTFKT